MPTNVFGAWIAFNASFIMPDELTITLIPLQLVPNRMGSGRLKNEKAKRK